MYALKSVSAPFLSARRTLRRLFFGACRNSKAARETTLPVERDGCRAAVCMSLAAKAALVVADEHYGVEPHAAAAGRAAQA